jgi:gamma-glutamylaminecyclotransferase
MKSEGWWPGKVVPKTKVFIYGSLLPGCHNHHVVASADFLFAARTKPEFDLIDLGEYPALVEGGKTAVIGSVYEVGAELLQILDEFEGHPELYQRVSLRLPDNMQVQTYLFARSRLWAQTRVVSGDWRTYVQARPS